MLTPAVPHTPVCLLEDRHTDFRDDGDIYFCLVLAVICLTDDTQGWKDPIFTVQSHVFLHGQFGFVKAAPEQIFIRKTSILIFLLDKMSFKNNFLSVSAATHLSVR